MKLSHFILTSSKQHKTVNTDIKDNHQSQSRHAQTDGNFRDCDVRDEPAVYTLGESVWFVVGALTMAGTVYSLGIYSIWAQSESDYLNWDKSGIFSRSDFST